MVPCSTLCDYNTKNTANLGNVQIIEFEEKTTKCGCLEAIGMSIH